MKRDLELIRKLLLYIEEHYSFHEPVPSFSIRIEGFEPLTIDYHLRLLQDEGYVNKPDTADVKYKRFANYNRLTMKGCEYLDSIRDEKVWTKVKDKLKEFGVEATLTIVKDYATEIIKAHLAS